MTKLTRCVGVFKNQNLILQTALVHLHILDLYSTAQIVLVQLINILDLCITRLKKETADIVLLTEIETFGFHNVCKLC